MDASGTSHPLPHGQSPNFHLTKPTEEELKYINWTLFPEWGDALPLEQFFNECNVLADAPLAKNNGLISIILTQKDMPPNHRPIFASCETFRQRALVADQQGRVSDAAIYGIASVSVNQGYRGQGYGRRLMQELAKLLPTWCSGGSMRPVGSVLFSDIGKEYYTKLGWSPPTPDVNFHLQFDARMDDSSPDAKDSSPDDVKALTEDDLISLCRDDEALIKKAMAAPSKPGTTRFMIVPDVEHMMQHISKENFHCEWIWGSDPGFRGAPGAKGAIAGEAGNRVWAVWVHRYYHHPKADKNENVLYILRFVIEDQNPASPDTSPDQRQALVRSVRAVLERAQREATRWGLASVKLWHPSPLLMALIKLSGIKHQLVQREKDGIASLHWFGGGRVEWLACEHYAWL